MAEILMERRFFLKALGLAAGGLALGLFEGEPFAVAEARDPARIVLNPNPFILIAANGAVGIICHRSEMGQGVRSTLPALFADELGVDPKQIRIMQGDGDVKYGDQNTDGSSSVRKRFDEYRQLAATARTMLVNAAAKRWGVPPGNCDVQDGLIVHRSSHRKLAFRDVVNDAAAMPVPKPTEVKVRPRSQLRHVFRDLPLVDGHDIVTGRAIFGADVKLPGMLTAIIDRPPVVGGRVDSYDRDRALAIPGVKAVVELPVPKEPWGFQPFGGVAVIAENTWAAMRGRAALGTKFKSGPNGDYDSDAFRAQLTEVVRKPGRTVRNVGDADAALSKAARVLEAEYQVPHLAHATMEPPVAVAHFSGGRCECWAPTQNPQVVVKQVAETLRISPEQVKVHVTLLGGGFGRKSKADYVAEAAWLSREVGAPVRVQWTREDDIQHDYYHTTSAQRLEAGLDAEGKVTAWRHRSAFPSISSIFAKGVTMAADFELTQGMINVPFSFPNVRGENCQAPAHVRIGWLRSVCNIHHAFAVSSFLDEIAHARKMDPRDFLYEAYGKPRHVSLSELGAPKMDNYGQSLDQYPIDTGSFHHVIERVTTMAGWNHRRGRALGLAFHPSFLCNVGVVVSVSKNAQGKIHVDEAWVVADAGTVVNTERARSQMEGAVIFSMSHALHGAITMKAGAVEQTNFRDYRLTRIEEAPRRIHVEIIKSEKPPGGIGEPGVPPVAPAIANAVFALTGKRIRRLPLALAGVV